MTLMIVLRKNIQRCFGLQPTCNNNGQLARRVDNAGGYTTDYAYDLAGRLAQSQQSAGRNARTTYSYDNQNRLKRQDNYIDGYLHALVL